MLNGPLLGKMVLFALPLAVSTVLQQLFNAADIAVVGRFASRQALAAVGSNNATINLLIGLFVGLSIGTNVCIAKYIGQGATERVQKAVHTSIVVALASGAFLLFFGQVCSRPMLEFMEAPHDVIDLATLYLRIYFLGVPFIMLYNFGSAILRSKGDSRRPFVAMVIAGVVNVGLNLFFVIVLHLHVIGVALATVLSNCLSGGLTVWYLMHEEKAFRLSLRALRIDRVILRRMVAIGLPAGIQGMVFSLSNVVIQAAVNSFGSDCIAGMTAGQNFDFISYCLLNAFAQACVTFTSQNYGAGDEARCRRVWRISMGMGVGIDMLFIALLYLLRYQVILLFTTDAAVIRYAMIRVNCAFTLHFLCATYEITAGALRGMNRSAVPALISIFGTCAARLLYVHFLFPLHRTPEMLILVYPVTWILTTIAMNTAYLLVRRRAFHFAAAG
ncbi:MAG: MATE family efflux transporter [Oscillospiraceae bacterium]|nr:MATE family efflux transporter [Oscillospiraceae bacterium]